MTGATQTEKTKGGYSHFKAPEKLAAALLKHARYSPSSMERLVNCGVSPFLSAGMPDEETEYSTEGTRAHELAEFLLEKKLTNSKKPIPLTAKDGVPFTQEMIRHCKGYAAYCYKVVEDFLSLPKHSWFLEKRLVLDEDLGIWGTADFVFVYKDETGWHLIIIDFKYGIGKKVLAEENWQLGTYGLAGLVTFEEDGDEEFLDVETHIFQPRSEHDIVPQLYTRQELIDLYAPKIMEAVERSEVWFDNNFVSDKDISVYQMPGEHCQFCRAKGLCKAYANMYGAGKVLQLIGLAKPKLDAMQKVEDESHKAAMKRYQADKKEGIDVTKPEKLKVWEDGQSIYSTGVFSDEDLAFLALNESKIAGIASAAKEVLKSQLLAGKPNDFVKLGKASPVREWKENDAEVIAGLIALGIDEPAELKTKLISITEVEKLIGKDQIDHLTRIVRETVRLAMINEDVEPISPPGLDVKALIFGAKKE